jgi:citrate synthase
MDSNQDKAYLNAREAAAELNVSRATLYAYVSRGLIRSDAVEGSRSRRYRADDVRNMRARKSAAGDPEDRAGYHYAGPLLDSAITLIDDGKFFYRGRDAVAMARAATLEAVAGLLWRTEGFDPFVDSSSPLTLPPMPPGIARCQAALAAAGETDVKAYNLETKAVARTGARVLHLLTACFAGEDAGDLPIHEHLARSWGDEAGADLIRAALVLCADHELNASTFTVRCVASTRATPYGAVLAGLAALQGPRHGGMTSQVKAMFEEIDNGPDVETTVLNRLRRGERLPGFGHPLYENGDPRWTLMRELLLRDCADATALSQLLELSEAGETVTGLKPNLDFATVSLQRCRGLPDFAPMAIFAIGRCVGWIAHAQEQYRRRELIRPRARYVGEAPQIGRADM